MRAASRRKRKAVKLALIRFNGFRVAKLGCCGVEVTASSLHAIRHAPGCQPGLTAKGREREYVRSLDAFFQRVTADFVARLSMVNEAAKGAAMALVEDAEVVTNFAEAYRQPSTPNNADTSNTAVGHG